jgi:hypothetical protein
VFRTLSVIATTAILFAWPAQSLAADKWTCLGKPVEPCVKRHGRLSSQNGIPFRLWIIGTSRVFSIEETAMPSPVMRYLEMTSENHSFIYGDFEVCPLTPGEKGRIGHACVRDAQRLLVQPLDRKVPPFRLPSTW